MCLSMTRKREEGGIEMSSFLVRAFYHIAMHSMKKKNQNQKNAMYEHKVPIDALVFEGGGVLGAAHGAAVEQAIRSGLVDLNNVHKFAGASAGAICAGVLACGASAAYLSHMVTSVDFKALLEGEEQVETESATDCSFVSTTYNWLTRPFVWLKRFWSLYKKGGLHSLSGLRKVIRATVHHLTGDADITFAKVHERFGNECVIVALSLEREASVYFSHKTHPDFSIVEAIVMSSAVPAFFEMVVANGEHFWDGGILDNYPMHVFDAYNDETDEWVVNPGTLGFKLVTPEETRNFADAPFVRSLSSQNRRRRRTWIVPKPHRSVSTFVDAIPALVSAVHAQALRRHVHKRDWERTVKIDTGDISTLNFSLTDEQKASLMQSGRDGVLAYLADLQAKKKPQKNDSRRKKTE